MARERVKFTFPPELISRPLVYEIGRDFQVITNIRRAHVSKDQGWVVLELDGDREQIERALAWVVDLGVRVDPVEGDLVEG